MDNDAGTAFQLGTVDLVRPDFSSLVALIC